jgi:hypothetical protein
VFGWRVVSVEVQQQHELCERACHCGVWLLGWETSLLYPSRLQSSVCVGTWKFKSM